MKKSNQFVLLTLISAPILYIAFLVRPNEITPKLFIYNALVNIAFIIITVVVVNVLWSLIGGEPIENLLKKLMVSFELLSDSNKTGLSRFYSKSADYGTSEKWFNLLRSAKKRLDMQGYSLHIWTATEEFSNTLIDLAKKGVNIRIIIMDPLNPNFKAGINIKQVKSITYDSIKTEIEVVSMYLKHTIEQLEKIGKADKLQFITCKEGFIETQICRVDHTQHIVPYLYSSNASGSPLLIIKGADTDAFKKYETEFDSLWELNIPVI